MPGTGQGSGSRQHPSEEALPVPLLFLPKASRLPHRIREALAALYFPVAFASAAFSASTFSRAASAFSRASFSSCSFRRFSSFFSFSSRCFSSESLLLILVRLFPPLG